MPAIGVAAMLLAGSGLMGAATSDGSRVPLVSLMVQTDETIPPLPRPAYIYAGRCGELGEIQWPLNPLVAPNGDARGSGAVDRTENSYTANVPSRLTPCSAAPSPSTSTRAARL
jgi:hypothetical protein